MKKVRFAVTTLSGVMMALLLTAQIAVAAPVASGETAGGAGTLATPTFVCNGTWFFGSAAINQEFFQGNSHAGGTFTFVEGGDAGRITVRMTDDGFVVGVFRFGPDPVDPNDEATITFASPIHITGILWHGNGPTPPDVGWSFNGIPGPVTGPTGVITPVDLTTTTIAMIAAGGESGGIDFCFTVEPPVVVGDEGCTPGYWKNHAKSWPATGFTTGQTLESVFDVPDALGLDATTLKKALAFNGGNSVVGSAKILLRAAVASLLNAAHPGVDFSMSTAAVIADVNAALASGSRSTMLTLATTLDTDNNNGCTLS